MSYFDEAFEFVLKNECSGDEISNHPEDAGGITKYGISFRFLKNIHSDKLKEYNIYSKETDDIINLTIEQAKNIYKGEFWDHGQFECIANLKNCCYIFDSAFNMGINPAVKLAQRSCWDVLPYLRNKLLDDGIFGSETIDKINLCGVYLLPALRAERAAYYKRIVDMNSSQEIFLEGWLKRTYKLL